MALVELFVIYSLVVAIGYAVGNVMDKVLFQDYINSAETMQFLGGLLAPIAALPALAIGPITLYEPRLFILTLATGVIFFVGGYMQMLATKLGEVSNMTLLLKTIPIFSLILGAIFLSERLTAFEYIGFAFIIAGAFLVALKFEEGDGHPGIQFTIPNILTIGAAFSFGASFVLMRHLLVSGVSVVNVFFWSDFGLFLACPLLLLSEQVRSETRVIIEEPIEKGMPLFIISVFIYAAANLINTFALNDAPAALVTGIVASDALFVTILVAILDRIGYDKFQETLTKKSITVKLVAGALFIIGAVLVG